VASVNLNSTLKNRNASYRIGDGGSSGNTQPLPAAGSMKPLPRGGGSQRGLHASSAVARGQDSV